MLKLLEQEIRSSLQSRGIESQFARFQQYAADTLDSTAQRRGTSALSGRCRSAWYDHLFRNVEDAPNEAERFTRELHQALSNENEAVREVIGLIAAKLELGDVQLSVSTEEPASVDPIEMLSETLAKARGEFDAALSPLSSQEIATLRTSLDTTFNGRNAHGHTLVDRTTGRRLCDLLEKMDQSRLFAAASVLARLSSPEVLEKPESIQAEGEVTVEGATGLITTRVTTPAGDIVIGRPEKNTYQLDEIRNVAAVVDLGGDDVYHEGTVRAERPVLIVIDLQGNDEYRGTKPGVQGSAILGLSLLVDRVRRKWLCSRTSRPKWPRATTGLSCWIPHPQGTRCSCWMLPKLTTARFFGPISTCPSPCENFCPRLRNSDYCRVLLVTLPDATPVHEALALQSDLERAGTEPYAWVINPSLTPVPLSDPTPVARQAGEAQYIEDVTRNHTSRTALVPWVSEVPNLLTWLGLLVSGACSRADIPERKQVA